jgi:hypothetical protein
MINDLNSRWKEFILNEGVTPDISVWVQSLKESLGMIKPRSMRESKRIELMKHQLNEIRKASNRLQRENQILQEENQLLQEQDTSKE